MARVILGSYLVRYPLGGNLSCVLQYLSGLSALGHDVWFVEKSGYAGSCWDPDTKTMGDDCTTGTRIVHQELDRLGLGDRWCYVDAAGSYHGTDRGTIESVFRDADVYVEMGTHEAWLEEAATARCRILIDGEPGFSQMWMENRAAAGDPPPDYDHYFTVGQNVGSACSDAPTAGVEWHPMFHPVATERILARPPVTAAPFTTVMNWRSHDEVEWNGRVYGNKDQEFDKFLRLPSLTSTSLELALSGGGREEELRAHGWRVRDAHEVTRSYGSFLDYIAGSGGEFSVCKHGYVATHSGWFSDRSAVYLATGRPVVQQDTGFSSALPCGEGLFAVRSAEEAAAALEEIRTDPERHSRAARELAVEHLDARKVLSAVLDAVRS